jgi:hypothetical protein
MPSATMADRSDSIPPSAAIVKAGTISSRIMSSVTCGKCQPGSPRGIPPGYLEPMVATSQPRSLASSVAATTATMDAGTFLVSRGHP